ncbi:MAG: TetR/AcrR family transcriptional regulator [Candidatus Sericytochromatia bacterium]
MFNRKAQSLTRDDVINAAIYCLEIEGENALGINRVAKELNIKPPSLYNHIKSNDDLYKAVVIQGWKKLLNECKNNKSKINNLEHTIEYLFNTFRNFAKNNKALYLVMSKISIKIDDEDFVPILNDFIQFFSEVLAPLQMDRDSQIHTIRFLRSTIHGFIILELQGQFEMNLSIEKSYDFIKKSLIKILSTF